MMVMVSILGRFHCRLENKDMIANFCSHQMIQVISGTYSFKTCFCIHDLTYKYTILITNGANDANANSTLNMQNPWIRMFTPIYWNIPTQQQKAMNKNNRNIPWKACTTHCLPPVCTCNFYYRVLREPFWFPVVDDIFTYFS